MTDNNRRPLKSRSTGWARLAMNALLATRITPNQISVLGIGFAMLGAWAMIAAGQGGWLFLLAALCIQLRLLCNMLDGMVAVEGKRHSPYGPLYNEIPDRIEDSLFLTAFGYAMGLPWLGWLASLLAVAAAYIRAVGSSHGLGEDFGGPMAKPHRMAALTLACIAVPVEWYFAGSNYAGPILLALIAAGTVLTIILRTLRIAAQLKESAE